MSGLAEILLNLGYRVSGSDIEKTPITDRLITLGLEFYQGHDAGNTGEAEILVKSAAIEDTNVELESAKGRGIPIIHRSDLLADLVRLKPNAVVVGGSHGKTTVTSMVSAILDGADIGATSVVGGILQRSGSNVRWGTGDCIVAEADEHDGSFLRLHPTISVVTNVDSEHLEYYGTIDTIKRAFTDFCNGVPFYGYSIVCRDDPLARSMIDDIDSVCVTYGIEDGAGLYGHNIELVRDDPARSKLSQLSTVRTRMEVTNTDERLGPTGPLGSLEVNAIGQDNARNALAACCVGLCLGMSFSSIAQGLAGFDGVLRRMQLRGVVRGATVIEDYAHHPTEIKSTFEALRSLDPARLICVFQPHLFSRTKFFYEDFGRVLAQADLAIVTDIYGSREEPIPGVDAGLIVDSARSHGADHVELITDMMDAPARLEGDLREGDVVLVMGAGNIHRVIEPLLALE